MLGDMSPPAKNYYPPNVKIKNTRLTPKSLTQRNGRVAYLCDCDCGKVIVAFPSELASGRIISCGCWGREKKLAASITHGLSGTSEYFAAFNAFSRCYNRNNKYWRLYGGRGIVCEFTDVEEMTRWLIKHLPKPTNGKWMLDREQNGGNYSKTNLRWATPKTSARNHRGNHLITIDGVTKCLTEWSEISQVGTMTIHGRVQRGFPEHLWLYKGKITKQMLWEIEYAKQTTAETAKEE